MMMAKMVVRMTAALVALALVLACCAARAEARADGGRRDVMACCEPLGTGAAPSSCGAAGYGYKWVQEDTKQRDRPLLARGSAKRRDADVQAGGFAALACIIAVVTLLGETLVFADIPDQTLVLTRIASVLAVLGCAFTQMRCTKMLDLSPLGWMRVANVASLMHLCSMLSAVCLGSSAERRTKEVVEYCFAVIITFAQEKLLWKPLQSTLIPLFAMGATILLRRRLRLEMSVLLVTAMALATLSLLMPAFDDMQMGPEANFMAHTTSPDQRLWAALAWPLVALPGVASICAACRGNRLASIAFGIPCLAALSSILMAPQILPLFARDAAGAGNMGRWCCLRPLVESGKCNYATRGMRWFHHFERGTTVWSPEVRAMTIITVLTNLSGIPVALSTWRNGTVSPSIIAMATIVFSTLYHLADTIDNTVLGMTEGNWHRLDNIFAILSFVSVQLYVLDATIDSQTMQQVRTGFLLLTVLLQEIGPWRLECTLIPVLASSAVLAIYLYKNQPIRASLSRNPEGAFSRAFALLGLGVMGFVKGLDEDTDWLRIAHGCWHLFTGLSFYYFAKGLHHVVEEHQAKRQF